MGIIGVSEPWPMLKSTKKHKCAWCRDPISKGSYMASGEFGHYHIPKCYCHAQGKYRDVIGAQIREVMEFCKGRELKDGNLV